MSVNALDCIPDPLITPILGLLKFAINADLAKDMVHAGVAVEDAVASTSPVPFALNMEGEGQLPALHCYRVRSSSSQYSIAYTNHTSKLQFVYASPAAGRDLLDQRWPLLDRVWHSLIRTLKRGIYPGYEGGIDVMQDAGVIRTDLATTNKREIFIEGGELTYPGFIAEVDVIWRDANDMDTGPSYPALSFDHRFYVDQPDTSGTPDVIARSVTEAGESAGGRTFSRPSDWSL